MAVVKKEDLIARLNACFGENPTDEHVTIVEDIADTIDNAGNVDMESYVKKEEYDALNSKWKKKYMERFEKKLESGAESGAENYIPLYEDEEEKR